MVGTYSGNTGISCQYGRKYCDHPFFTGGYSVDEDGNITSRTSESVGSSLSSGTYYFDFPCETAIDGIRYENVYKAVITASTNLTLSSWYDWDTGYYTCIESMKSNGVTLYLLMPIKQTNYVLGSYIEDIYAVVGTYPDNGTSGSYWYIKQ